MTGREPVLRRAARRVLTWGVRGRGGEPGAVWGEAVLGEFEETTGTWDTVRWTASGLRVAWRERRRRPVERTQARLARRAMVATLALILAGLGVNWLAVGDAYIASGSMSPTLRIEDRVLVDKLTYRWARPHRGDIVVMNLPGLTDPLVKRVIGLPGDTIACRDGRVYRNGAALAEPYLVVGTRTACASVTVPAGTVYVLGDDRDISRDSRDFGPVPRGDVKGRVLTRVWPLR